MPRGPGGYLCTRSDLGILCGWIVPAVRGQRESYSTSSSASDEADSSLQYVNHLTPIPKGLALEVAAPILCAGVTVWKAIKQSNTKVSRASPHLPRLSRWPLTWFRPSQPGDYILIAGAGGGLGHLAVQYAVAQSLRVIAVDSGADKKALCASYGVDTFLDFKVSRSLLSSPRLYFNQARSFLKIFNTMLYNDEHRD